jgi:hypothetical protein
MGSQRIRIALVALVLAAGAFFLLLERRQVSVAGHPGLPTSAALGRPAVATAAARPEAGPAPERSELADELASPAGNVHADLAAINAIFEAYRSSVHGMDPVGENREITAVLTGHNKLGFAFIPTDCPALNAKGELCDRWGTPYFFHQIAGDRMEVRSAGPDHKLWTDDDVVFSP